MQACQNVFPEIVARRAVIEKMQPGFTLTNFFNWELRVPITVAVIDFRGVIRWHFQNGAVVDARGDIDVRSDPEGILIGGTNIVERADAVFPVLVDWDQRVIWRGKIVNHHHIHRRRNGNFIFLINEAREIDDTIVASDIIVEYDPKKRTIVWMWRLLDYVTPDMSQKPTLGRLGWWDWSHCNTIEEDPEGRFLYLSARNLNSVFKIERKTGHILWRLGEDGDFKISGEDRFYHQHAPELQPNGNLLIFDNGTGRPAEYGGNYSRAVELEIDEDKMEAKAVWCWGRELGLFAPIWGDADRLEKGNTLITFGTRTHPKTSRLIEVTEEKEVVWDIELKPSGWGMYRAERLKIAGNRLPVQFI